MKCTVCAHPYDLTCANVSERQFSNSKLSEEWKCETCKSKQPKGDNSNTPVRGIRTACPDGAIGGLENELKCDDESIPSGSCNEQAVARSNIDDEAKNTCNENMITAVMAAVKAELPSLLSSVIKVELEPIRKDIQSFIELKQAVLLLSANQEEMQKSISTLAAENQQLKADNYALHSTVTDMSDRLNNMEQHLRENNLEIHGIPEYRAENIRSVLQHCANVVNHQIGSEDVVNCTRVAKQNRDSKLPRTIIVRFKSVSSRDEFYSAVHRYNKSHPRDKLNTSLLGYAGEKVPVYVSEHLSQHNKALHAEARKKAKAECHKYVWVRNGRIYVRKDETSQYILIKNLKSLELIK